ncbi:MAG: hypothetical protein IJD80_03900 [Oscillospiraceae bacterium]|nr:hypothetical protein [Oscillospiraceae bacterium]
MQKEPFIITLSDDNLPNLASDNNEDFGFEFSKTNLWQEDKKDIIKYLESINEKLDIIVYAIRNSGKE